MDHGLGLADVSSDRVIAAGDESAQLRLSAPDWEAPAYSPSIVALLPTYILSTNAINPFFIVVDPDNDERYVQACVAAIDEASEPWEQVSWRIEYRAGNAEHHYGSFVTGGQALTTRVQQWVAHAPEFFELEWEKMDFSDYEFEEDED